MQDKIKLNKNKCQLPTVVVLGE